MAKKNKKFTKINQKIKKFFDNEPFDIGIQRVDSQTLSELMHYLGIYDIEYTKPIMIKTIRHLWSTSDTLIREQILDFFIQNKKIDDLLLNIMSLKEENQSLRQELVSIKAQCEVKNEEIRKLQELYNKKEQEIQEIEKLVEKIESMIG